MDFDDEPLTLSSHALAALQQFKHEEQERIEQFESLYKQSEDKYDDVQKADEEHKRQITIDAFQEDWQLSQFWYADDTAEALGKALLEGADENTVIAIASAPSVYAAIKKFPAEQVPTKHIYLFEYDTRFELLAGKDHFYFYDYKNPQDIPTKLYQNCHRLLIDPPYLTDRCQTNSAIAAHNLLTQDKSQKTVNGDLQYKLVSSTGERMRDVIKKNYPDTRITDLLPQHKNGLSNEFRCYATFECSYWKFDNDA